MHTLDPADISIATPGRIRSAAAARILGVSRRSVQGLALRGELPGAARIGGVWTFDAERLAASAAEAGSRSTVGQARRVPARAPNDAGQKNHRPRRKAKPRIYFIRCGGFVKIGVSRDPSRRIRDMVTGNPHDMELLHTAPGDIAVERRLHEKFRTQHHHHEWFRYEGELAAWLDAQARAAA